MRFGRYLLRASKTADALWTRYCAEDSESGAAVEVCVAHREAFSAPIRDALKRRLKLIELAESRGIRRVIERHPDDEPAWYVLEAGDDGALQVLLDRHANSETPSKRALQFVQLATHAFQAVADAHRVGLIHGRLTSDSLVAVSRVQRANGNSESPDEVVVDVVVDFTLPLTSAPSDSANRVRGLANNGSGDRSREDARIDDPDAAGDVFAMAGVLRELISQRHPENRLEVKAFDEVQLILQSALKSDSTERASAFEIAEQLRAIGDRIRQPFTDRSSAEAVPSAAPAVDATIVTSMTPQRAATDGSEGTRNPGRLGRFELLNRLGSGAMGDVWLARDPVDDVRVAIKVLNAQLMDDEHSLRRFSKEARMLAQANCPHVACLLEHHDAAGTRFLALEYVPGGPLADVLRNPKPLPERAVIALVLDAARGLAVAHQRGIVHRDIKPDNILLTDAGREFFEHVAHAVTGAYDSAAGGPAAIGSATVSGAVLTKVSDFGLASAGQQSQSLAMTQAGTIMGTPLYMSPEQCRGEKVDARSDVYSLGATLFHLLTGRPPFEGETHVAVMHKHCHDPLPSLRQLRGELSEAVIQVVERCLAKNPASRYATAGEVCVDLENLRTGSPTSIGIHPPTPATDGLKIQQFAYEWNLTASPAELWPYVSHTDRVNHAIGLPAVRYSTRIHPERGVERFAEMKIAGQQVAWQEHPYEWVRGRRLSVLREFSKGPFTWFVNVVELAPRSGGGTRLRQTFIAATGGWLGALLARIELGFKARRNFGTAYQRIDRFLTEGGSIQAGRDAFGTTSRISSAQSSRLDERLRRLREHHIDPTVIEVLGQFLRHASDVEVARIRPLAFAERFRLDVSQVVNACLLATREGLLSLLWDILCPSCRIPADVQETLAAVEQHGYCEACNVKYELDLAKSVELIFRAHPEVRDVETRTYCIGGPAWSAHVVAQIRVAAGERFLLEADLEEGEYRLRGPQLPFVVDLRTSPRGVPARVDLSLDRAPSRDQIPVLQAGQQAILLHNNTPHELLVRIERTASDRTALTAADASALPLFREMFPDQVLSPGRIVSVAYVTLMAVQVHAADRLYTVLGDGAAFTVIRRSLDEIRTILDRHRGAIVRMIGDGLIAVFSDPVAALTAAIETARIENPADSHTLDQPDVTESVSNAASESVKSLNSATRPGSLDVRFQTAVHQGPAMVATINDRLDYFGQSVHLLHHLLEVAGPGEVLASQSVCGTAEAVELIRSVNGRSAVVESVMAGATEVISRIQFPQKRADS